MKKCQSHPDAIREWQCWDCEGESCDKCDNGKVYTCDECEEQAEIYRAYTDI